MRRPCVLAFVAALAASSATSLTASNAAIGFATANGSFQLNASKVWGNGTLLEGSVVETGKAPSELRLNNGAQLRLATDSRATVYGGRLSLERGSSQIESGAAYPVDARSLRVYPASHGALARVALAPGNQVVVAAIKGAVRITNAGGVAVANLSAGASLSFDPQAGAAGPTRVAGCLLRKDGKFIVVDQTTNVTLQVQGPGLEKELGNKVEIAGAADPASPTVAGASQVINVQNVKRVEKGGCLSIAKKAGAAAAGAGAAGAGAAAAGVATATTVAVVGGVAVAATVGGLAAAGTFSGEETRSSTSR